MGDENGNLDYEKYYPTKQFQLLWVKEYLQEANTLNAIREDVSHEEVSKLQILKNISYQRIKRNLYTK